MSIKLKRSSERIGISIITFMVTSMLGMACGSLGTYHLPAKTLSTADEAPGAAAPGAVPSPRPDADRIIAGHRRGFTGEGSFYISGLREAAEPFAKVLAMDEVGNIAVTTAATDGSFSINAVPPGYEVKPGRKVYLSQIVPNLGESIQVPLRIAGD